MEELIFDFEYVFQLVFGGIFLGLILHFSVYLIQALFDVFNACVEYKKL